MVNRQPMLISEFARATGLTPDTVRFYVRLGLLTPTTSSKGGRNPYSIFTDEHVKTVENIRLGQLLGLSLNQMVVLRKEEISKGISSERGQEIGRDLLKSLEKKATDLNVIIDWLRASIKWTDDGEIGHRPKMPSVLFGSDRQ